MKKKETKVLCPECGTELAIAEKEFTTVATVIGKDSGLGTVYAAAVGKGNVPKPVRTAHERIEALRDVGVDVSHLFAMHGANGGECIASNKNGRLTILEYDDPIFSLIMEQGTVPNSRLFRRWVMAQMFRMLTYVPYRRNEPGGVTAAIHNLGYEYQWKMLLNELHAQMKMEHRDPVNFADRNRWFNAKVAEKIAEDYVEKLKIRIKESKNYRCKGIPYKKVAGRDIFVSDLNNKLYGPLFFAARKIGHAKDATQLYEATRKFNDMRVKMRWDTPQSKVWIEAYKGSGAFFTMQNLIRFHGCIAYDDNNKRLDKQFSLAFVSAKAEEYKNGEGWRLLAVLKKMLDDNGIDIKKKMREWSKKKK